MLPACCPPAATCCAIDTLSLKPLRSLLHIHFTAAEIVASLDTACEDWDAGRLDHEAQHNTMVHLWQVAEACWRGGCREAHHCRRSEALSRDRGTPATVRRQMRGPAPSPGRRDETMKEPEDMPLFGAEGLRQLERVNEERAQRQGRPEASAGPAPVHDRQRPRRARGQDEVPNTTG